MLDWEPNHILRKSHREQLRNEALNRLPQRSHKPLIVSAAFMVGAVIGFLVLIYGVM